MSQKNSEIRSKVERCLLESLEEVIALHRRHAPGTPNKQPPCGIVLSRYTIDGNEIHASEQEARFMFCKKACDAGLFYSVECPSSVRGNKTVSKDPRSGNIDVCIHDPKTLYSDTKRNGKIINIEFKFKDSISSECKWDFRKLLGEDGDSYFVVAVKRISALKDFIIKKRKSFDKYIEDAKGIIKDRNESIGKGKLAIYVCLITQNSETDGIWHTEILDKASGELPELKQVYPDSHK